MNVNAEQMESVMKFVQGSIWHWSNPDNDKGSDNKKAGIIPGDRPVLIISNDNHNKSNFAVTCLTITSSPKDGNLHEPLMLFKPSYIQCEQIHTIPKTELRSFYGIIPAMAFANVKERIKCHLSMTEDRDNAMLAGIAKDLNSLQDKLDFIIRHMADYEDYANIKEHLEEMRDDIALENRQDEVLEMLASIRSALKIIQNKADSTWSAKAVDNSKVLKTLTKIYHRIISSDAAMFSAVDNEGADLTNDIAASISEHDILPGSSTAQKHAKKTSEKTVKESSSKTKYAKKIRRVYTVEDKEFIVNPENSIKEIIEKYGFENKRAAYNARNRLKKDLAAV